VRDQAEGRAHGPALEEAVDAEAGDGRDRIGEIELFVILEALALVVVEDAVDDLARLRVGEDREPLHRHDPAAVAHRRREPRAEVNVGCADFDHTAQDSGEIEIRL
jgi:hypothetical protein